MPHFTAVAPPPTTSNEILRKVAHMKLNVIRVKPDYEDFLESCKKVGDDWHLRPEHTLPHKVNATRKRLESAKTVMWKFMQDDEEIGFCCAVKDGFDHHIDKFIPRGSASGAEIYKIGLYEDYTGNKYGYVFLPIVMGDLFEGLAVDKNKKLKAFPGSDIIYLNTRSTNHIDSAPFYLSQGWTQVGEDRWILPSDGDLLQDFSDGASQANDNSSIRKSGNALKEMAEKTIKSSRETFFPGGIIEKPAFGC